MDRKQLSCSLSLLIVPLVIICSFNPAQAKQRDKARYIKYQQEAAKSSCPTLHDLSSAQAVGFDTAEAAVPGTVNNGGFEDGDFQDWIYGDNGVMGLDPWRVCTAYSCGFFYNNEPKEGMFDALNGFDGEAGYEAYLFQDIQVPSEGGQISFYDRIQYDGYDIPSTLPRTYEVQVRDLNNDLLKVLFHKEIMLDGRPETDLGWQKRILDVSEYAGQMIRVYIQLSVPEDFTGPAQIEFDDFQLTEPVASSDVSGCISLKGASSAALYVFLDQPGEPPQETQTDENGCYKFDNIVPNTQFSVIIDGPVMQ